MPFTVVNYRSSLNYNAGTDKKISSAPKYLLIFIKNEYFYNILVNRERQMKITSKKLQK